MMERGFLSRGKEAGDETTYSRLGNPTIKGDRGGGTIIGGRLKGLEGKTARG